MYPHGFVVLRSEGVKPGGCQRDCFRSLYQRLRGRQRHLGAGIIPAVVPPHCPSSVYPYYPFIEGVSERAYTDQELADIDSPPVTFEGRRYTAYEATQKQRSLERTIRKQRRLKAAYEAAGLAEDAAAAGSRLKILNRKYREFSRAAGLPEQRERMRAAFADDASARKAAEALEKRAKSDIIGLNKSKETPEVGKLPAPIQLRMDDVTSEYLSAASPGQGAVTYEEGYQIKGYLGEIKMADWLCRTFGGDIKLLAESKAQGNKTPDFLWNGRCWELKGVTSKNSIDRAVREAAKQIQANPGGIILDISGNDLSIAGIEAAIGQRIPRIALDSVDALLIAREQLERVLRYKK